MDRAIFKSLQAGAKFDRSRFSDAINLFENGRRSTVSRALDGGPAGDSAPASSLDFFGTGAAVGGAPSGRKTEEADDVGSDSSDTDASDSHEDSSSVTSDAASGTSGRDSDDDDAQGVDERGVALFAGAAPVSSTRKSSKAASAAKRVRQRRDAVQAFRSQLRIKVTGAEVADPIHTFADMSTPAQRQKECVLRNVEASAFKEPTPIQMQAMPCLLGGRDVLGIAPTGSGKTAAFAIPLFLKLQRSSKAGARGVILAPTRELALQIKRECDRLAAGLGLGIVVLSHANLAGARANEADKSKVILPKADVIIATPKRLAAVVKANVDAMASVTTLILDEADQLFEMGFLEKIDTILAACKKSGVQRAMFSATMPEGIEALVKSVVRDYVKIRVGVTGAGATTIKQRLLFVGREQGKLLAMRQLVTEGLKPPVLVFLQSKARAQELFDELKYDGIRCDVIHAGRSQAQRDAAVQRFRIGETWVLITTDLMCRGMDFKGVNLVVNYDFPQSGISYVHRIGRTGRAGRAGEAVTFFTEADMDYLRSIANIMRISGCDVPAWMLAMKKLSSRKKQQLRRHAPKRHSISTGAKLDERSSAKKRTARRAPRKQPAAKRSRKTSAPSQDSK